MSDSAASFETGVRVWNPPSVLASKARPPVGLLQHSFKAAPLHGHSRSNTESSSSIHPLTPHVCSWPAFCESQRSTFEKCLKDTKICLFLNFFLISFISNVAPKDTKNENYKGRRGETTCAETEDTGTTARSASSWRVCRPPHAPMCPAELLYSYCGGLGSTSGDLADGLQGLPAESRTQRLLVPAEPTCPSSRMQNLLEHPHPSLLPR